MRLAYSQAEVAEALGVSKTLIEGLVRRGDLPSVRVGRRRVVRAGDLDRWLEAKTDRPTSTTGHKSVLYSSQSKCPRADVAAGGVGHATKERSHE